MNGPRDTSQSENVKRGGLNGGSVVLNMGKGRAGMAPTTPSDGGGGWVTKAIIVQIQVRQTGRREVMESAECETSHSHSCQGGGRRRKPRVHP